MNFFLLLFSFFNFSNKNFLEKEVAYQECIYSYNDYYVYEKSNYQLYYQNDLLREFELETTIKILSTNNKTYIFSIYQNELLIVVYDNVHNLLMEKTFTDLFYHKFNIYYQNNLLYFIGGITEYKSPETLQNKKAYFGNIDAIIFTLDDNLKVIDQSLFGGCLNEHFIEARFYKANIYLSFNKDVLSGGDFGYGGGNVSSYGICILNNDLILKNYLTIQNETIFDFRVSDELVIATNKTLYRLDHSLNMEESVKFPFESVFAHLAFNNSLVVFGEAEAKIYDLKLRAYICDSSYDLIKKIRIINNAYEIDNGDEKHLFKIYDIRDIPESYDYNGEIIEPEVNDMFSPIDTIVYNTTPYFNPLIYGDYKVEYEVDGLFIEKNIHIPILINVTEGIIYPVRYKIRFTGIAYLNNNEVMNNHSIENPGEYRLDLIGCDKEVKTINFTVAANQIAFIEDFNKNWDLSVKQDSQLMIQIPYQIDERFEVISAWINDQSYPCVLKNDLLKVQIKTDKVGIITYHLQAITYLFNDKLYDYQLSQKFVVNILKDNMDIQTDISSEKQNLNFNLAVDDPDNCLRGINVVIIKKGKENRYCFPIANGKLDIPNNNAELATINLIYDLGDGIIKEVEVFNLKLDNQNIHSLGEVNILEKGKTTYKIIISVPKDKSIKDCRVNNEIIYKYMEYDFTPYISIGIFGGIIVIVFIKIFIKNKKHR